MATVKSRLARLERRLPPDGGDETPDVAAARARALGWVPIEELERLAADLRAGRRPAAAERWRTWVAQFAGTGMAARAQLPALAARLPTLEEIDAGVWQQQVFEAATVEQLRAGADAQARSDQAALKEVWQDMIERAEVVVSLCLWLDAALEATQCGPPNEVRERRRRRAVLDWATLAALRPIAEAFEAGDRATAEARWRALCVAYVAATRDCVPTGGLQAHEPGRDEALLAEELTVA